MEVIANLLAYAVLGVGLLVIAGCVIVFYSSVVRTIVIPLLSFVLLIGGLSVIAGIVGATFGYVIDELWPQQIMLTVPLMVVTAVYTAVVGIIELLKSLAGDNDLRERGRREDSDFD